MTFWSEEECRNFELGIIFTDFYDSYTYLVVYTEMNAVKIGDP